MYTNLKVYSFIYFKSDFQGGVVFELSEEQAFNKTAVSCLVGITDFPSSEHVIATGSIQWCQ